MRGHALPRTLPNSALNPGTSSGTRARGWWSPGTWAGTFLAPGQWWPQLLAPGLDLLPGLKLWGRGSVMPGSAAGGVQTSPSTEIPRAPCNRARGAAALGLRPDPASL